MNKLKEEEKESQRKENGKRSAFLYLCCNGLPIDSKNYKSFTTFLKHNSYSSFLEILWVVGGFYDLHNLLERETILSMISSIIFNQLRV